MLIQLVWDRSGSMAECGKQLIARGIARAIEQYVRLGYVSADLRLIAWGNDARVINWQPDQEFPEELLLSEGSSSMQALVSLLGTNPDGRVLIITDGFWSPMDRKVLKRWKEGLRPDTVRFIKVGADANPHMTGRNVFSAEDVFAVLDGWLEEGTE
ncbi:hypothetical protein [Thermopirellula anaerolimosa]